jgi:uncharacterized protein (UPF0332 family)
VSPRDLMTKAVRAVSSAKLLIEAGDVDGASNRAYYAMFDAARAVLTASGSSIEVERIRTHAGLISAFSMHVVKTGMVPPNLGRALNRAQQVRLVADYTGGVVDPGEATRIVQEAEEFVATIEARFGLTKLDKQ